MRVVRIEAVRVAVILYPKTFLNIQKVNRIQVFSILKKIVLKS